MSMRRTSALDMAPYLTALCLACLGSLAACLPYGAPLAACQSMLPEPLYDGFGHTGRPQQGPPPYNLTFARDDEANFYTVTLTGSVPFKGFLIQGRNEADTIMGDFLAHDKSSQRMDCGELNSYAFALTHGASDDKLEVVATWYTSPEEGPPHKFYATVLQNVNTFWVKIEGVDETE